MPDPLPDDSLPSLLARMRAIRDACLRSLSAEADTAGELGGTVVLTMPGGARGTRRRLWPGGPMAEVLLVHQEPERTVVRVPAAVVLAQVREWIAAAERVADDLALGAARDGG